MSFKALTMFLVFDIDEWIKDKTLVFVKADSWQKRLEGSDSYQTLGTSVCAIIAEDNTNYGRDLTNFGELVVVKVRDVSPDAYEKLIPFQTELTISEVEKATVYGDYSNQLSIIGKVAVVKNS